MHSTSKINSTLSKRRRLSRFKKVGYNIIFALFFISLLVLGLTSEKVQVKAVTISGDLSVSEVDILSIVEENLSERHLFIIRTDNFFLLKRGEIKEEVLNKLKKIESVGLSFHGLNRIEVSVSERVAKYLWCNATPTTYKNCYFMDNDGFIFTEAPDFSGNPFPKYFGLIKAENPIGQNYFEIDRFKEISQFFKTLADMKFGPVSFNSIDIHQYEIYLSSGTKIIFDDKKDLAKNTVNLQALIDNGYVKTELDSLRKIKYIDLRFGNKVILR